MNLFILEICVDSSYAYHAFHSCHTDYAVQVGHADHRGYASHEHHAGYEDQVDHVGQGNYRKKILSIQVIQVWYPKLSCLMYERIPVHHL